ncbi:MULTISPECIES: sensory box histidine kinase PhoR [Bacillus]|uniref:sensory box histidine kinase PhoR n=1 Tax=Bacillus TaxID=1386 RepID=UPI0002E2E96B|nr:MULTISPECIES: sensory box histidine kinase PhoR [Bacillus]ASC81906.1 PAS domain-containing sensor histidine kinase [Bacillus subtilis]AXP49419.1 PAS domain-containing sensor histidine kinase [Bacillus subtilis subsp. subtilis]AYK60165.1 PAS domain-containing protein [Bacillus subtilis subsp. subtilis]KAA0938048.1 PAS domain-containing protein [Bacillus sp. ANT_WA51]MBP3046556.1 sensory box histidine kinase PhoR [Bacillus subtilis subsp. subtilis]
MNKYRVRLFSVFVVCMILVFCVLGLFLQQLFETSDQRKAEEHIEKEAKYLASLLDAGNLNNQANEKIIKDAGGALDVSASVIDTDGKVLYGSNGRSADSQKVQALVSGHEGILSTTDNKLYYGLSLRSEGEKTGYVLLSASEKSDGLKGELWGMLTASLCTAFIVIVYFYSSMTSRYKRSIESATNVATELSKGNYDARTYGGYIRRSDKLGHAMNSLAIDLMEMTRTQEMQRDRLLTVIENIGSGLIMIDGRGFINLVNRSYAKQFHINPNHMLRRLYHDAFEHEEVIQLVEDIFMTETKKCKLLRLPIKIERRYFEVDGVPIMGPDDEWKGIVLVFHDMTETKKLEQMRKDFVANVSHELKTPITSIKGFTETLLDGAMEDKEALSEFLSIILKESERLQSLVQDLLDLSKIEQQNFTLSIETFEPAKMLGEIETLLKHKADEKGISLQLNVPKDPQYVSGDPYRLKQVFLNLVNNALTYTPEGGSVAINVKPREKDIQIEVADSGIGIQKEEIPRIFERFYRVDKDRSRNSGGTGLGLAIVKHLIEAHEGKIDVTSEPGRGTVFTVTLKRAAEKSA